MSAHCCRLHPALASEAPERGMDATSLLLDLAERVLNACAAALAAADPGATGEIQRQYEEARQATLQHALDQGIGLCARGAGLFCFCCIRTINDFADIHALGLLRRQTHSCYQPRGVHAGPECTARWLALLPGISRDSFYV